jgi:hypothetical protein
MTAGGFCKTKPASIHEQVIAEVARKEVEAKVGHVNQYKALEYTTQVVAGLIYLIKVQLDTNFVHLKIIKPLPHMVQI